MVKNIPYKIIDNTPAKTKQQQPKTPEVIQERDNFLTPAYATNILLPYLHQFKNVWEQAAGAKRISNVLNKDGIHVISSDINGQEGTLFHNYITDNSKKFIKEKNIDVSVTNPPFSLKEKFIEKGFELGIPFALLIPMDMSSYLWNCFKNKGLQCLVPERRIDFFTPRMVHRVNIGEGIFATNKKFYYEIEKKYKKLEDIKIKEHLDFCMEHVLHYEKLEEIPYKLFKKYTSSDFHSFWVVYKFNLEKDFTFVPLSLEDKKNIL